jgi:NAD(P)-dependent dehydrogenase (short-subunit alcohol dehydrogenase family)
VTAVTNSAPNSGALVVTGGGRGIGAQIALRAARHGTPVAFIGSVANSVITLGEG